MLESSGIEGSRIKKTPENATSRIAKSRFSGSWWHVLGSLCDGKSLSINPSKVAAAGDPDLSRYRDTHPLYRESHGAWFPPHFERTHWQEASS